MIAIHAIQDLIPVFMNVQPYLGSHTAL